MFVSRLDLYNFVSLEASKLKIDLKVHKMEQIMAVHYLSYTTRFKASLSWKTQASCLGVRNQSLKKTSHFQET
jgi:hypothetical protein